MLPDVPPLAGTHAYRAKLMDNRGRIETTVDIIAETDGEAIRQVTGLTLSYNVEVWDGGRKVTAFPKRQR